MNVLNKLTINSLKLNKKRTIVTIIGIMLSVALMTAVTTMYQSLCTSLVNYEKSWQGDFHATFKNVDKDGIENIKNNRSIEKANFTKEIGFAKLETKNEYKPYACIIGVSEDIYDEISIRLESGRFPDNDSEIVIPTHLKTNGKYNLKIGDKIELEVGKRVSNDGEEWNQGNPYMLDEKTNEPLENIVDTVKKEYTVVGLIERPSRYVESYSAPGYSFFTKIDKIEGNADAYCRWKKSAFDTFYKDIATINGIDSELFEKLFDNETYNDEKLLEKCNKEVEKMKYKTDFNTYLLQLEDHPLTSDSNESILQVIIIVLVIIVVSSVFCIKNSFDISITEKIRQYGMLRSVGATKKQIRRNVLYEATILGIIGIISGLLLGVLASFILVRLCNHLMEFATSVIMEFDISLAAILIALMFSIITIYLSALRSAIKASKVSPIQSIRNSGDIKIKAKKLKAPKYIKKLFGIGGEISYKNIKRNKKKYRTTVISITVSAVIFIALTYFMNLAIGETKEELKLTDYNFAIDVNDIEKDRNICKDIVSMDNIKSYAVYNNLDITVKDAKLSKEYIEFQNINVEDQEESTDEYITIMALNKEAFSEYCKKIKIDANEVKNGAILNDHIRTIKSDGGDGIIEKFLRLYTYKEGDTVKGIFNGDEELSLKIVKCTDQVPYGFKEKGTPLGYTGKNEPELIINIEEYEEYFKDVPSEIRLYTSNATKLQDDLDNSFDEGVLSVDNIEENYKNMQNVYIMIGIFLYGFITVITLIGITNIFNTITTSVYLRKREFATLRSVGMTNKEFNKMVRLESFFIGAKALIFGVPLGIILCYFMNESFDTGLAFVPPLKTILVTILAVFLLIFVIMNYSLSKVKKQNTIETIRNENI